MKSVNQARKAKPKSAAQTKISEMLVTDKY